MVNPIVQRVQAAQGNSLIADEFIRDYLPFIQSQVAKFQTDSSGGDELSIGLLAFHEAIESYQADRGAFLNYASLVMKNRLIDYYRSERRHDAVSLSTPIGDDQLTIEDTLVDPHDHPEQLASRSATVAEIEELSRQLQQFGLSLSDIADDSPRQERTYESLQQVLHYARDNPELIKQLLQTKKLPLKALAEGSGVHRKVLERHRKYIMALMIIYSNGYEIIRHHIGFSLSKKGGTRS